jgi:hypothetical protein
MPEPTIDPMSSAIDAPRDSFWRLEFDEGDMMVYVSAGLDRAEICRCLCKRTGSRSFLGRCRRLVSQG